MFSFNELADNTIYRFLAIFHFLFCLIVNIFVFTSNLFAFVVNVISWPLYKMAVRLDERMTDYEEE